MCLTDRGLTGAAESHSMESFKLAHMAKISPKSMLLPQVIALVIGVVLAFFIHIWGLYTFGWNVWSVTPADFGWWPDYISGIYEGNFSHNVPNEWGIWIWHYIAGIILAGVVMFLSAQFIWFPLNIVGFAIGASAMSGVYMFVPNLIALIGKYLLFKFGGTKLYEEYAMPFAAGLFIVGFATYGFGNVAAGIRALVG